MVKHSMRPPEDEGYVYKSQEFERDLDRDVPDDRVDRLEFGDNANDVFLYDDADDLAMTERGRKDLRQMLDTFLSDQVDRLDKLKSYTEGQNWTIMHGRRRIESFKADYRIAHDYGRYISTFITGYLLGKPVTVSTDLEGSDDLKDLAEIDRTNDSDALNYNLAFDMSRYGRAYELEYRADDETDLFGKSKDRIAQIDSNEMFCIYSADVSKRLIGALHCPEYNGKLYPVLYTDDYKYTFEPMKPDRLVLSEPERKQHFYGEVPVVEWWNNRYRQADFENVIPQIDALDAAQSDTANYMSDLNDAMLVVKGDIKSSELTKQDIRDMAISNTLILENGIGTDGRQTDLDAKYIYKQYDSTGSEAYKDRLVNDIFKLSNIPNLDDGSFGTASGIAIQYKLIGLRQLGVTKANYIKKALRRRYRLISNIHRQLNDTEIDVNELNFTFHENIPEDIWSEVNAYISANGKISQQTLQEIASFIDEQKENDRLQKEEQENARMQQELERNSRMSDNYLFNGQESVNDEESETDERQ